MDNRKLYLDLMKKSLAFLLWPEPPSPVDTSRLTLFDRMAAEYLIRRHGQKERILVEKFSQPEADRWDGKIWPAYAHTMIGMARLNNLQSCVETVLADRIE